MIWLVATALAGLASSAAEMPALAELLDDAGWEATPELSGVFKVGSVFVAEGEGHSLMVRDCFEQIPAEDSYTSAEIVSTLEAGVRVKLGFGSVKGSGELVKRMAFAEPVHTTLERLAMEPTAECAALLARATPQERTRMYAISEVLTALISEQTCGRIDATGSFVGLGKAEAAVASACTQESLEPVAVGYRVVPIATLLGDESAPDCSWPTVHSVSTTMTSVAVNGELFDVRRSEDQLAFSTELQRCGADEAAQHFETWRGNRRTTNIACSTLLGCYPFSVGLWYAWKAKKNKERFEEALRTMQ